MRQHIELLGLKARDKITGFKGVITTVSFDLYGCIQVIVTSKDMKKEEGSQRWLDISRLETSHTERVMEVPSYFIEGIIADGNKGASVKPLPGN